MELLYMDDESVNNLKEDIKEIKVTNQAIYKILNGNGTVGLVTRVALLGASLGRAWGALWLIIIGLSGLAFYIIRCGLI